MFFFLISSAASLAYVCDYPQLPQGSTHYLYKEESLPIVKWLPKSSYCHDKGNPSFYSDAGKLKCEYSRGICIWQDEKCIETLRPNDWIQECESLLENNELSMELDNGRIKTQPPKEVVPKEQVSEQTTSPNPVPSSPVSSSSRYFLSAPLAFCVLLL
jgi:hypothetical protein